MNLTGAQLSDNRPTRTKEDKRCSLAAPDGRLRAEAGSGVRIHLGLLQTLRGCAASMIHPEHPTSPFRDAEKAIGPLGAHIPRCADRV